MKIKTFLTLALTLTLSLHVAFGEEEETALGKQMKTINKSLRALKKQAADPAKKDENLGLVETMKKGIEESLKLEPAKTKDVPEAEKAAYLEKFKKELTDMEKTVDELGTALKADKADDVKAAFEKLGKAKEQGHKDFKPEDK